MKMSFQRVSSIELEEKKNIYIMLINEKYEEELKDLKIL
jgi:hypothetical protein